MVTYKSLAVLSHGKPSETIKAMKDALGIRCACASDWGKRSDLCKVGTDEAVLFEGLGIALINAELARVQKAKARFAKVVEPERMLGAGQPPALSDDTDEDDFTWGIKRTRVNESKLTGRGVRIAVLDTGIDLAHPDFKSRGFTSQSFTGSDNVQDDHGHGTHCIGTVWGPKRPSSGPRYGIAHGAELLVGKVADEDVCEEGWLLAGVNWAVKNRCDIVSISIGDPVDAGKRFSPIFEHVAGYALAQGTLIIAAAGNSSRRREQVFAPVDHPANCPSVMSVGSIGKTLKVSNFSVSGVGRSGGGIDIVGPGEDIYSSWSTSDDVEYWRDNGTSMATPFVAGIAALYAEAHPKTRGRALKDLLLARAQRLASPLRDTGKGLVQAPR